jgi:SAM-dependent methyltransferase
MIEDKARAHYVDAKGRVYHEGKRGIPDLALPWVSRLRAEKFVSHIRADDTVLEFGVGSGWNLAALPCKSRLGYDVSDFLAPRLRALGIEFCSDTKLIADSSIDVVICHHTLEHVAHPSEILQEIRRLLRPQGKLLLFVPYEKERRYRQFRRDEPNHHLYSWNVQTLGNLVEECDFTLFAARLGEFGYDRFAAVWADKLKLGENGFRFLRCLLHLARPMQEVRINAVKTA